MDKKTGRILLVVLFTFVFITGLGAFTYYWTTHATFDYSLQAVVILEGQSITAGKFLDDSEINEGIEAEFNDFQLLTTAGLHSIPLTLRLGWRSLETSATLYILSPIKDETIEYTQARPSFTPADFISNSDVPIYGILDLRFTEEPLSPQDYPVGETTVQLALNGTSFEIPLYVADTTPPTATAVSKQILIGEPVFPEDFVTDVFDASHDETNPPIISFVNEPDIFSTSGYAQIIEIKIEDKYGNYDIFNSALTVSLNREPPVIEGLEIINVLVGNTFAFLDGVFAYDDFGRDLEKDLGLEIKIINNTVNQFVEGIYSVTYYAEDLSGLVTEVDVLVYVLKIDPDYVDQRVDEILAEILKEGMTQVEQARVINNWVRANIANSGTRGGPPSTYEAAYRALRDRRGNCRNFYALSAVLLTRAGIPNMQIDRVAGYRVNHRWNLINPDELGWHHFDSRTPLRSISSQLYMFTASQAENFSRRIGASSEGRTRGYYHYDPSLYPPIVP